MDENFLYHQISENIRQQILSGELKPGEKLLTVREMSKEWGCTPGTVQRAYQTLTSMGLVVSYPGKGTMVVGAPSAMEKQGDQILRKAMLVNRSESFLLETLTQGFELSEIQQALDLAMDRWRSIRDVQSPLPTEIVRFVGSHDMVINGLVAEFSKLSPGSVLQVGFAGSMGGLIALANGSAEIAGSHLWDVDSNSYNIPFIEKVLPGQLVRVYTLSSRRLGLIVAAGNPMRIEKIDDLVKPNVRFINRQKGSGTRVWLDSMLQQMKLSGESIKGYEDELLTHSDVARGIAENFADVGVGLESAAMAYGLDFVFLTKERYDLVLFEKTLERPEVQKLIHWLASNDGHEFVDRYRGYDASETGVRQI